jgi:nitrogen fixation protein NifU and related proteins
MNGSEIGAGAGTESHPLKVQIIVMGKYSETMMDHVLSPRNGGVIEHPDLTGHSGTPGRGAFLILFLRVEEERISAAKYHTLGCGPTIACGSMLSELVLGKSIAECRELTANDLIEALDGVPPDKLHCPALAIGALRDALTHWEREGRLTTKHTKHTKRGPTVTHRGT